MKVIARVRPKVLAINGGDGTVQAALTEIYNGGHFGDEPPPVAVLPSGKTNLIALDLGARGDPIETLERLIELARTDLGTVHGGARADRAAPRRGEDRPVIGMFLGGAGLADTMLYCREQIYPLGLPNGIAHGITGFRAAREDVPSREGELPPARSGAAAACRCARREHAQRALLAACGDHARKAAAVQRTRRSTRRAR